VKFGIAFANILTFAEEPGLSQLAQAAEQAGFESLWTVEHVVYPDDYGSAYPYDDSGKMAMTPDTSLPDPLVWLTWVGAVTETIRLATGILILPQRNPVVLAKEVATIDHLTGGRMELGIGVGWLREEFDALGVPFERRGARTDEYIGAMRALWDADHAEFHGDFVDFAGVSMNPKPARGRVPITIGGHSRAAAERAGRIGDGFFPGKGDIAELADIVRQTAADCGRDPEQIEITFGNEQIFSSDPVGEVERLAGAGVDRVIVPSLMFLGDPVASLSGFGENVIGPTADL